MSAQQNKADDRANPKKDVSLDVAFKKLVDILVAKGIIKEHQVLELLKDLK